MTPTVRSLVARCILGEGRAHPKGYRTLWTGTRDVLAHRAAYEATYGPIPDGLEIHHRCENKACVNPEHLVALTSKQHKAEHAATHCQRGHEFTPKNSYVQPSTGRRYCRECKRAGQRRLYHAKKATA